MALTNHDRVRIALDLLRDGLRPFVERECLAKFGKNWLATVTKGLPYEVKTDSEGNPELDAALLLRIIWDQWQAVFQETLGHAERSLVSELREVRNRWAHQTAFSTDDAHRALDSAARLLTAISAPQADELDKMRMELLRVRFDEQVRGEKRKSAGTAIESAAVTLKPWREVVTPHRDVASGRYQQAEFAADLWQVHIGGGSDEYKNPVEFFRRTYLTDSLKRMLVSATRRLTGQGGDPVVQLQTNFGGGKTHSMLALYHLFSGANPTELLGLDAVLNEAGVKNLPKANRVVLVGNKLSPGNPSVKPDGTKVHTLWGELAWQLGGKNAYARIQADDKNATSPGDALRELFDEHSPCLILIDEWVAYARQLHDSSDLPAGSFETQFSFAQALTESAKLAKDCLLVVSLPASDTSGSPHTRADDVEVGGQRGREALDRLRNVIGRIESSWRPASAEEGFEIVRRRLFEPMTDAAHFKDRDVVARAFADYYRAHHAEFPPDCREADYENRIKAAYPIHPEVFDRLYTDWSTLIKFQRTRGVLRLMASVIHSLWEKGDKNPLILPANVPIDDPSVQIELTRYLSDNWVPVIEKDVDGPGSLPLRLDNEVPNLGKVAAARRVARTVYLGSAPLTQAAHRGLEDRRIKLGCVMPGESAAVFGDALRRLAAAATYLYQDGSRYWYSTQPTVTKLADDRAEQLSREPDKVAQEIEKRLRDDLRHKGEFNRVHPLPQSAQDIPDDLDARLVVLGLDQAYTRDAESAAITAAQAILDSRGSAPRLYRNTLIFLAADKVRLQDLDEAARKFLAWQSILDDKVVLNLDPQQVRQAEAQKAAADSEVNARLPETYQWLLVPGQSTPQDPVKWEAMRLTGGDKLAVRASKKLRNDEMFISSFAATRLRMELDRVPLWRGNHVAIKQLAEDFAQYLYLPRLKDTSVLEKAVDDGLSLTTWDIDSFAYADSFDEAGGRYRGLRAGQRVELGSTKLSGLLVRPDVAVAQYSAENPTTTGAGLTTQNLPVKIVTGAVGVADSGVASATSQPPATQAKRFFGTVVLDTTRVGRDASKVADEVIAHLAGLVDAQVKVTIEIEAHLPSGVPDHVIRTVTENSRALRFTSHGFEGE